MKNYFVNGKNLIFVEGRTIVKYHEYIPFYTIQDDMILKIKVNVIGESAFSKTNIQRVLLPSAVTTINKMAFWGCKYLEQVSLPEGLIRIGYGAFSNCNSLTEIQIPSTVRNLGVAFENCKNLKTVEFLGNADFLTQDVFYGSSVEKLVFHGYVSYNRDVIARMSALKEICILNENVSKHFWRDALNDNPFLFAFISEKDFGNQEFVNQCLGWARGGLAKIASFNLNIDEKEIDEELQSIYEERAQAGDNLNAGKRFGE